MTWERPKTIALYLHPPAAARVVTLWPDAKIISAPVSPSAQDLKSKGAKRPEDFDPGRIMEAFGFRLLFGKDLRAPDINCTRFEVRPDGIPIHALTFEEDDFYLRLESFCSWEREPVTFVKLEIMNRRIAARDFNFGLMPATGRDEQLYENHTAFYRSYAPSPDKWKLLSAPWTFRKTCLKDGPRRIVVGAPAKSSLAYRKPEGWADRVLVINFPVAANASQAMYVVLTHKARAIPASASAYATHQKRIVAHWRQELKAVRVWPKTRDPEYLAMYRSWICQCLQMFAIMAGGRIIPRQGACFFGAWPTEAFEFLMAFDRIGLGAWARKGYDFFRRYQISAGPDRGRVLGCGAPIWTSYTGALLIGLGYHLVKADNPRYFRQWRSALMAAIGWIERARAQNTRKRGELGFGLFPPGRPHDWNLNGQYWCFTDGYSLMGLESAAVALAHYQDPAADRLKQVTTEYRQCMEETLERLFAPQKTRKETFITNVLEEQEIYPPVGPYFLDGPVHLIRAGVLKPASEILPKVEAYFRNRGWMLNGLTGLMTDWGGGKGWYVNASDVIWCRAWKTRGEQMKAAEAFSAQLKYAMTSEYYLAERFVVGDPWLCPFQPNASANGRMILLMLDLLGEKG